MTITAAQLDRFKLLDNIHMEHAFLERTLAPLTPAQLIAPDVIGYWSIKDTLAHIAAWEAQCRGWFEGTVQHEDHEDSEGFEAENTAIYQRTKDLTLDAVLTEFNRTYTQTLRFVQALSDDDLFKPQAHPWMRDREGWSYIGGNTWWHYAEHGGQIRAWLGATDPQMDKLKLLDLIRLEHDFLLRSIAPLTLQQLTTPGVIDDWSVKDLLAHIMVWEQRLLRGIRQAQAGETPDWPEPGYTMDDMDRLNVETFARHKDRSLVEVLADFQRSYGAVLAVVAALPEAVLIEPGYFAWTGQYALWQFIDANSSEHYAEHVVQLRAWAEQVATG